MISFQHVGKKHWLWIAVSIILAVFAAQEKIWYNFGETLEWLPGDVRKCNSVEQVLQVVQEAKSSGKRVKPYGTGWSWSTTIAGDGDIYVRLTGSLADASRAVIDTPDNAPAGNNTTRGAGVVVAGGVEAFGLYMILQETGYNIEAKGACLLAEESQTIGGLLATNVHHSGIRTFYDVVEWIEVVTSEDGLVRTYRDETLFRLTIGGAGRTGVIVNAKFNLAPRSTYQPLGDIQQPADDSYEAFFQGYVDATSEYEPMEAVIVGSRPSGILGSFAQYSGQIRETVPSPNPVVLPPNYGELGFVGRAYIAVDPFLDAITPCFLYDFVGLGAVFGLLGGEGPVFEGKDGQDLDVVASGSNTPHLKHQELELFVPVDLMGQVGAYLDKRFAEGCYPYIRDHCLWYLRKVFGCNSLTAANGVLPDGTSPDVVAVNMDSYQRSAWPQYNGELIALMADLSAEFPDKLRTHPGKFNAPVSKEPQSVKDAIANVDPSGVFAREDFEPSYLTEPPDSGSVCKC